MLIHKGMVVSVWNSGDMLRYFLGFPCLLMPGSQNLTEEQGNQELGALAIKILVPVDKRTLTNRKVSEGEKNLMDRW